MNPVVVARSGRLLGAGLSLLLVSGLTGCAQAPLTGDQAPAVPGAVTQAEQTPVSAPVPAPQPPSGATSQSAPLGERYLTAARVAQQQEDWTGAIEQAELGLRIDRRQPQLYLVLAQSYWRLGKAALASQFARQGLRYLGGNSEVLQQQLRALAYP